MTSLKPFLDEFFHDLTALGSSMFYGGVLLLTLLAQEKTLFFQLLLSFLTTSLIVIIIKLMYFKPRPKRKEYQNFIEKIDASAFPSWHTARAIFLAFLFSSFFKNDLFSIFFLLCALGVASSRIYLKKHDWWDVAGGAVLGAAVYWAVKVLW